MTLLDKTFENLLRGLDAKADPKSLQSTSKKFDLNTRLAQYANGEREFFQQANTGEMEMRAKVSSLNLQKSPLQPVLNDIFLRKPKRHGDKSSLSNDARTNFADLFDKMNAFWELSDSKKTAGMMFDLKLEGGDKEAGQQNAAQNTEGTPTAQSITPIKSLPKEQHLNTHLTVPTDVGSPIYHVAGSPLSNKVGTYLTVDTNADKNRGVISPINTADLVIDKKFTPGIRGEDSLDTSQFKPVNSITHVEVASRDTLDKEEENRRIKEEQKKEEEEKKKIEATNKIIDHYMEQMPDFGYFQSAEIVQGKNEA